MSAWPPAPRRVLVAATHDGIAAGVLVWSGAGWETRDLDVFDRIEVGLYEEAQADLELAAGGGWYAEELAGGPARSCSLALQRRIYGSTFAEPSDPGETIPASGHDARQAHNSRPHRGPRT